MSNKLKPCPFCEAQLQEFGAEVRNGILVKLYIHPYPDDEDPKWDNCPLSSLVFDAERWQSRPIEDALNATINELTKSVT